MNYKINSASASGFVIPADPPEAEGIHFQPGMDARLRISGMTKGADEHDME